MKSTRYHRKNFLVTFFFMILSWGTWAYVVLSIPPERSHAFFFFFASLFLSLFLTVSLLFVNSRRGFLFSIGIVSWLILRRYEMDHVLNLVLLGALIVTIEVYLRK